MIRFNAGPLSPWPDESDFPSNHCFFNPSACAPSPGPGKRKVCRRASIRILYNITIRKQCLLSDLPCVLGLYLQAGRVSREWRQYPHLKIGRESGVLL